MAKKETKRCSVPGCQRKHKAKGLCNKHYIRQTRTGAWVKPKKDKKKCSEEGCGADAVAKGLCNKHYKRLKKNGETAETRRYLKGYKEQALSANQRKLRQAKLRSSSTK
jgi:hypothetical protein